MVNIFSSFCVGVVLWALILAITYFIGVIMENDDSYTFSWILSSVGLSICLTIQLIQNGII